MSPVQLDRVSKSWYGAAHCGPTSYTRRGLLGERRDELARMVRAIGRTGTWVAAASGAGVAQAKPSPPSVCQSLG